MFLTKIRKREAPTIARIDVSAYAAIMLAFVMMFMLYGAQPHRQMYPRRAAVDLTPVRNPRSLPEAKQEDAFIISVQRDGAIYVQGLRVQITQVRAATSGFLHEQPGASIFFECDMRARWEAVRVAVEEARLGGAHRLVFLTEKTRE